MNFTPYLLLKGNCAEAMQFYHTIFGGELKLMTVSDTPMQNQLSAEQQEKIINARLKSDIIDISASDWLHPTRTPQQGNTVCLYLSGGTYENLKEYFDKLAVGADPQTLDPLTDRFYGTYGALTDKFGIRWMFQGDSKNK